MHHRCSVLSRRLQAMWLPALSSSPRTSATLSPHSHRRAVFTGGAFVTSAEAGRLVLLLRPLSAQRLASFLALIAIPSPQSSFPALPVPGARAAAHVASLRRGLAVHGRVGSAPQQPCPAAAVFSVPAGLRLLRGHHQGPARRKRWMGLARYDFSGSPALALPHPQPPRSPWARAPRVQGRG